VKKPRLFVAVERDANHPDPAKTKRTPLSTAAKAIEHRLELRLHRQLLRRKASRRDDGLRRGS
jgi:hypothetical protein